MLHGTVAISGSRLAANDTIRFYRESAALRCSPFPGRLLNALRTPPAHGIQNNEQDEIKGDKARLHPIGNGRSTIQHRLEGIGTIDGAQAEHSDAERHERSGNRTSIQSRVHKEANVCHDCEGDDLVLIGIEGNVVVDKQQRVFQTEEVGHRHAAEVGCASPQGESKKQGRRIVVDHQTIEVRRTMAISGGPTTLRHSRILSAV